MKKAKQSKKPIKRTTPIHKKSSTKLTKQISATALEQFNQAIDLCNNNKYKEGMTILQELEPTIRALKNPKYASFYGYLAKCYSYVGELQEAVKAVKYGCSLNENDEVCNRIYITILDDIDNDMDETIKNHAKQCGIEDIHVILFINGYRNLKNPEWHKNFNKLPKKNQRILHKEVQEAFGALSSRLDLDVPFEQLSQRALLMLNSCNNLATSYQNVRYIREKINIILQQNEIQAKGRAGSNEFTLKDSLRALTKDFDEHPREDVIKILRNFQKLMQFSPTPEAIIDHTNVNQDEAVIQSIKEKLPTSSEEISPSSKLVSLLQEGFSVDMLDKLTKALTLCEKGKYKEGLTLFKELETGMPTLCMKYPQFVTLYGYAAQCYIKINRFDEANKAISQGLSIDGDNALCNSLSLVSDMQEAIATFKEEFGELTLSNNEKAQLEKGINFTESKQYQESIKVLCELEDKIFELKTPVYVDFYNCLSVSYYKEGKIKKALDAAECGFNLDSNNHFCKSFRKFLQALDRSADHKEIAKNIPEHELIIIDSFIENLFIISQLEKAKKELNADLLKKETNGTKTTVLDDSHAIKIESLFKPVKLSPREQKQLKQAMLALGKGDHNVVIYILEKIEPVIFQLSKAYPDEYVNWYGYLANSYVGVGKFKKALKAANQGLSLDSSNALCKSIIDIIEAERISKDLEKDFLACKQYSTDSTEIFDKELEFIHSQLDALSKEIDALHLETDIHRRRAALHDREMAAAHLEIMKLNQKYLNGQ